MNYGRFFRLNQALSKVVDGVAIYDYIDLPAYFGPSVDNPMSPKYPISVTITSDAICFRLHYSSFKIEKSGSDNEKDEPRYAYDKEDINKKAFSRELGSNLKMAHMEEVILELPYSDNISTKLSDTIKEVYNTKFPLQEKEDNISYGGRFIDQLIRKRYPGYIRHKEKVMSLSLEDQLYHKLQIVSDNTTSYSSLWLMDLYKKDEEGNVIFLYDNNKKSVIGFLRKLLLDFMFDLKHSDVFQNSANYQKMYSGLMSNFYFSALIHKCEYYYYRKLIRNVINNPECDLNNEATRNSITTLYAEELFRAENLWVKDIISPQAEEHFEYRRNNKYNYKYEGELFEKYSFSKWDSWFAEPEEEMKRVCFTMRENSSEITKDKHGKLIRAERHLCNADIMLDILQLKANNSGKNQIVNRMVDSRNMISRQISQWFLMRYDFNDVCHLHLYKKSNLRMLLIFISSLFLLFVGIDLRLLIFSVIAIVLLSSLFRLLYSYRASSVEKSRLEIKRTEIIRKRIKRNGLVSVIFALLMFVGFWWNDMIEEFNKLSNVELKVPWCAILFFSLPIIIALYYYIPKWTVLIDYCKKTILSFPMSAESRMQHVMTYLHLLLPRLVASVTAAWLTISMGFDLYVSFFDQKPNVPTIILLVVILLLFVMYEINKVTPRSNSWVKLYRGFELMVISYTISVIAGIVVVNFTGEKFMERGGFVGDGTFYDQYVDFSDWDGLSSFESEETNEKTNNLVPDSFFRKNASRLRSVYHSKRVNGRNEKTSLQPLVERYPFFGFNIFVMRDFLIMFSFVAMFIGIFIQLIIFGGNKQMTEL